MSYEEFVSYFSKRKQVIINKSNQKENKSWMPYEDKVGEQVSLETPGILRILSIPCTGPYPVTNVYKSGTIRIQKDKKELYQKEWISVESFHSIQIPNKYNLGGNMTYHRVWIRRWYLIKLILRLYYFLHD
jgi:hypothetical protein